MRTPVIIPAYNEAERIGASLRGLDHAKVEPFVVVNGEQGRTETYAEAARYTSNVFLNPEQGKLPAVQLALRNARRLLFVHQHKSDYVGVIGSNISVNFAGNDDIIDEVLAMPHIWPGEDKYLIQKVSENSLERYTQLTSFGSAVVASARYLPPLTDRFTGSRAERKEKSAQDYKDRRAIGATHYYGEDDVLYAYEQ